MRHFKKLIMWNVGIELVKQIYFLTHEFPVQEQYGLSIQCRRSAVSIPSNIAEGSSRRTRKDQYRFLEIALGSCFELETQVILMRELGYAREESLHNTLSKIEELQKMITGYMKTITKQGSVA